MGDDTQMELSFFKLDGAGNDFVGVDWSGAPLPAGEQLAHLAVALCDRHRGVGADGLLLLTDEGAGDTNFRLVYLNRDGSRAEMCGNGARCAAVLAHHLGLAPQVMTFLTDAGPYAATASGGNATVNFPDIHALPERRSLVGTARPIEEAIFLRAGVPHAVILVDEVEVVDVEACGRAVRFDPAFAPAGANANFYEATPEGILHLRTYERGVEAETRACGTGAVATACCHAWQEGTRGPQATRLRTSGGESLSVSFIAVDSGFTTISLTGPARIVFRGSIKLAE